MKIYISLPITGHDENKTRHRADLVKGALSRAGHIAVNPFDIYAGEHPTYADNLCADLRVLADCDAIYLCDGWTQSRGCRIEYAFAKEFGLQIINPKSHKNENKTVWEM